MENSNSSRDRISELPQPVLHHILSFLPHKKSVQTCVISKSWRNLGSTRPNLVFLQKEHENKKTFVSVLDKILHRYHDQKLCFQEFHVELKASDPESVSFLERWFPYLVEKMGGAKTFDLSLGLGDRKHFDLPLALFENSKSIRFLRLCGFRFSPNLPMDRIHLEHLQTLCLNNVHIADEAFQNIMSSCQFIERLDLFRCEGLTTIKLMNNNHLKRFHLNDFHDDREYRKTEDLCFVDVPNLESMEITQCGNYWFNIDRRRNMYFPGLKSLKLMWLRLPMRPSLEILSCDFPSLQDFFIHNCTGFGELRVLNCSVKHLTLKSLYSPMKVVVDAPNLELLDYKCYSDLDFSFATTSEECISKMAPGFYVLSEGGFLELRKLLETVSQSSSKIHLELPQDGMCDDSCDYGYCTTSDEDEDEDDNSDDEGGYNDYLEDEDDNSDDEGGYNDYLEDEDDNSDYEGDDNSIKPVAVDYLLLNYEGQGYVYSKRFLNRMFRYCRPRNIMERQLSGRSRFLCKKLVLKQNRGSPFFWQQDLEEASMELWDKKREEWNSVEATTFLESIAPSPEYDFNKHHEVWFKLKWRE